MIKISANHKILIFLLIALVTVSCSREEAAVEVSTLDIDEVVLEAGLEEMLYDKSIAVLPFTDLSENSDQEYFSDGL
ncbi:MAG: hypothetical protein HOK55_06760, partial [Gammaproteobacteria bacterium]|nr:hypothetical protein [Gammaproteobacteria bacterium]